MCMGKNIDKVPLKSLTTVYDSVLQCRFIRAASAVRLGAGPIWTTSAYDRGLRKSKQADIWPRHRGPYKGPLYEASIWLATGGLPGLGFLIGLFQVVYGFAKVLVRVSYRVLQVYTGGHMVVQGLTEIFLYIFAICSCTFLVSYGLLCSFNDACFTCSLLICCMCFVCNSCSCICMCHIMSIRVRYMFLDHPTFYCIYFYISACSYMFHIGPVYHPFPDAYLRAPK